MQTKLQELTEKIYQEGVLKAQGEAERIIAEAKEEAQKIKSSTEQEVQQMLTSAEKEAENIRKTSMNELQLAARQAMVDLKQRIVQLLERKTVSEATAEAFENPGFIKELIALVVKNWDAGSGAPVNLEVLLPESKRKDLNDWLQHHVEGQLNNQLTVSWSDKIKEGFQIGPQEGVYRISFSDTDFNQFFLGYLRPKLVAMLFEGPQEDSRI